MKKYLLYAIGEILLVMVGILLALEVNNWNEEKRDRRLENLVLEDIRDNIIRNNELIESTLDIFHQINVSKDIVLGVISTKGSYSDSLSTHFSNAIRHGGFLMRLNFDGYESLKNVGFGIIENESLKDQILSLFEVTYNNYEIELQWGNTVYSSGYGWWKKHFYQTPSDKFIPIDYNELINSKDLLSELNELSTVRSSIQKKLMDCLTHNRRILDLLGEELRNTNGDKSF